MLKKLPSIKILGIDITIASEGDILEYIFKRLQNKQHKFYIVTPNPEILMRARGSKEFANVLNGAEVSLPDGVGLLLADRMKEKRLKGRITGADMMVKLCEQASKQHATVGFLGGSMGVAEKTAKCLRKKYPDLIVRFASDEWVKSTNTDPAASHPHPTASLEEVLLGSSKGVPRSESPALKDHVDILFVAFGAPKQEEWIAKNLPKIDVTCAMGVGGAFDYISGNVARAPKVVRNAGLEWAFRLLRQPWRVRRQLALPLFATAVVRERFFPRK